MQTHSQAFRGEKLHVPMTGANYSTTKHKDSEVWEVSFPYKLRGLEECYQIFQRCPGETLVITDS